MKQFFFLVFCLLSTGVAAQVSCPAEQGAFLVYPIGSVPDFANCGCNQIYVDSANEGDSPFGNTYRINGVTIVSNSADEACLTVPAGGGLVTITRITANGTQVSCTVNVGVPCAPPTGTLFSVTNENNSTSEGCEYTLQANNNIPCAQDYDWTISPAGGVITSPGQSTTSAFLQSGTYEVCLEVTLSNGCTVNACQNLTVNCMQPCEDHRWTFRRLDCLENGYSYQLFIGGAGDCGDFTLTTNGNNPSLYGFDIVDGDLIINGFVSGIIPPGQLCVSIDFESEACCDFEACARPRNCCQIAPIANVESAECVEDASGNTNYVVTVELGNPDNLAAQGFTVTANCGTATATFVNQGNTLLATVTITNVSGNPGDVCCLTFDFDHPRLCNSRTCFEIPECGCYRGLEVDFPDCVEPGVSFCVTYNYVYQGDPQTGVSAIWDIVNLPSADGWEIVSGGFQDVVNFGQNSHEVCYVYNGEECDPAGNDLVVRAYLFYGNNIECCTIIDEQSPTCCCDDEIEIVYCSDPGGIDSWVASLSKDNRRFQDKKIQRFLERYGSKTESNPCESEECCPICEPPYFEGPLVVQLVGGGEIPDNYQITWSTGETNDIIIGTLPPTTYSVTVYDPEQDCEYVTEVEIACPENEEGGVRFRNNALESGQLAATAVRVYPNPADATVFVSSTDLIGKSIHLTNQLGARVLSQNEVSKATTQLDVSPLTAGIYFLQIVDAKGTITHVEKVVLTR